MEEIKIRGHRGAVALAPENTIQSFQRAVTEDVYSIEFDVRQTRDGALVLMHDETLDRTTDGSGAVDEKTLEEIKTLSTGGEPVPTLEEALDYFQETDVSELRIELKERAAVEPAYRAVKQYGVLDRTVFHSFDIDALRDVKSLYSAARTSATTVELDEAFLEDAKDAGCEIVTLHYNHTTEKDIEKARDYGFKTDLWAVEDAEDARSAYRLQPDYVGADDPCLMNDLFNRHEQVDTAHQKRQ